MHGSTGGLYSIRCFDIFDLRFIIIGNKIEVFSIYWVLFGKEINKCWKVEIWRNVCKCVVCWARQTWSCIMRPMGQRSRRVRGHFCGLGKRRIHWNYVQQSSRRSCDLIKYSYIIHLNIYVYNMHCVSGSLTFFWVFEITWIARFFLNPTLEDSDLCGLDADAAQRLRALQVLQGATGCFVGWRLILQSGWKSFWGLEILSKFY